MKLPDTSSIRRWLLLKAEGEVLFCSLNFPEKHNALSPDLIRALTEFFSSHFLEMGIRVIILKGEGPSFCAGADLQYMKAMANFSPQENLADAEKLFEMFETVVSCEVPVIALAHGNVYGGGVGLLACCDISLALENTKFCFSEVRLGLAPAVISPFVMRKMQLSYAHRYFLSAEIFGAKEAQSAGLISAYGSEEEMTFLMKQITENLLAGGPLAQKAVKQILHQDFRQSLQDKKATMTQMISNLRVSAEGQEGMRAFFEKRKPNWQQQK
ncbi:MAG: enoyl-CoA hydratase-related protein [Leptospiraceae bacterium]|nr:enoyl-CoA hydratase-related protein [Leptospiraceae bacterium]MDW8306283.1 enoyl-CoA hydratase-related protein [Leptospiraceae bacterium]